MQTIGEKLEEARKRRGISLREASEVTKIRTDYLGSFESNSFDLNLPEIYIRGFLRAYAQFLKLNGDKIITDYNAHQLGESEVARNESREFLGRMDIPGQEGEQAPQPTENPLRQAPTQPANDTGLAYNNFDKAALIKGGAAVAGAGVLVAVIVFVVLAVLRSGPDDATAATDGGAAMMAANQELTLIANGGDILSVTVTERSTGQELFRGPLNEGESQTVPFDEQVRLSYSNAEFLHIEHDGLRYEIGGRGVNRSSFPRKAPE